MCDWLNLFYDYDTISFDKVDGRGYSNTACLACLAEKTKLMQSFKLLSSTNKSERFSYKGEWTNT